MAEMKLIKLGGKRTRYDAELIAKANGGRIVNHSSLDTFMMERNRGAYGGGFWAREFATKGLLIEKGKDLLCNETKVLVEANELKKAHEASEHGIFRKKDIFLMIDPETLILKADTYILENPKITVVANAMSPDGLGKVDPITRIAVRTTEAELEKLECLNRHYSQVLIGALPGEWTDKNQAIWSQVRRNHIKDGIWALMRKYGYFDYRQTVWGLSPSATNHYAYSVLISKDNADAAKE